MVRWLLLAALGGLMACGARPEAEQARAAEWRADDRASKQNCTLSPPATLDELLARHDTEVFGRIPDSALHSTVEMGEATCASEPSAAFAGELATLALALRGLSYEVRIVDAADERPRIAALLLADQVGSESPETATGQGRPDTAVDYWLQSFQGGSIHERRRALDELELDAEGVERLRQLLGSDSERAARLMAVARLDLSDGPEARRLLLETLSAGDDDLVATVLDSMQRWREPQHRHRLVPLLEHSNSGIRESADLLLQEIGLMSDQAETESVSSIVTRDQVAIQDALTEERIREQLQALESGAQ
ncbi:MAG: hypothetical protein AAF515_01025 [Pseudomonadota bacterium]